MNEENANEIFKMEERQKDIYKSLEELGKESLEIDKLMQSLRHMEKQNTVIDFWNRRKREKYDTMKELVDEYANLNTHIQQLSNPMKVKETLVGEAIPLDKDLAKDINAHKTELKPIDKSNGSIGNVITDNGTVRI